MCTHKVPDVKSQDIVTSHGTYAVEQRLVKKNMGIKARKETCEEPDVRRSGNFKGFSRSQIQSRGLKVISWRKEGWV